MAKTYDIGLGNNDVNLRKKAESDFVSFWDDQAKNLSWFSTWKKTLDWQPPFAKWFVDGKLNVSYNCVDRHVEQGFGNQVAIYFEGEPGDTRTITY